MGAVAPSGATYSPSRRWARCLVFLSLLAASAGIFAATFAGKVVGIADGDTITVLDAQKRQYKIRLAGIDAPERHQPFGNRSEQHLADLVYHKDVEVEWKKYDRYGRIVGKVRIADPKSCSFLESRCPKTLDAGLAQIQAGFAWHYGQDAHEQSAGDYKNYAAAERKARTRRTGLWNDPWPIMPWEWRNQRSIAHRQSA